MLSRGVDSIDLGSDDFLRNDTTKVAKRLMRRLGDLGYDVSGVVPTAAA